MPQKVKSIKSNDTWLTPKDFYQDLDSEFNFDYFDPCPPDCDLDIFNGLKVEWSNRTFYNPPYSRKLKEQFLTKAFTESLLGKFSVGLVPVSTSTRIFHELIKPYAHIEFVKGRLAFEGVDGKGNWCNPNTGMYKLDVPEGTPQVKGVGQSDLMLVMFGDPNVF